MFQHRITLLLSCLTNLILCSDVVWRYTNIQRHGGRISTRDVLSLEAVTKPENANSEDFVWTATTCNLSNSTGKATHLRCSQRGSHTVDLTINGVGNRTRQLRFYTTYHCYDWYLQVAHSQKTGNSPTPQSTQSEVWLTYVEGSREEHQMLKVWIVDHLHASKTELNDHAEEPSLNSRRLTQEYNILGQLPSLQLKSSLGSSVVHMPANFSHYNSSERVWVFTMHVMIDYKLHPTYIIRGKSVALYDCFVRNRDIPLAMVKFPNLEQASSDAKHHMVGNEAHSLSLRPDPCQVNIAAVLVRGKVYLTQDDFVTLHWLPAPVEIDHDLRIIGISLMYNYLAVLSNQHEIFYMPADQAKFNKFPGTTGFSPTQIASADWCVKGLSSYITMDLLAMTDGTRLMVSNSFEPAVEISLPLAELRKLAFGAQYSYDIQDVSLDVKPGKIGVSLKLVINGEYKMVFAQYDYKENSWSLAPFWADFKLVDPGQVSLYFLGTAKTSFYFRNEDHLFYSYDNSENYGTKRIFGCTDQTSLADEDHYIRDVIVSRAGDISILLDTNNIIYGKVKIDMLVPFDMGSFFPAGDLNTVHWFDSVNRLWFITVHEDETVERLLYPVADELRNALEENDQCPYTFFSHNVNSQVYLLDKQDTWSFWAYLVFRQSIRNSLDIIFSDSKGVIKYSVETKKEFISGVSSENLTVTFSHKHIDEDEENGHHDEEEGKDEESHADDEAVDDMRPQSSVAILELRPHRINMLCDPPYSAVAYMSVGCPKGRNIRVRAPSNNQHCRNNSKLYPKSYTIPSGLWNNLTTGETQQQDKTVEVDPSGFGCPIIIDGTHRLKPILELYDYDKFVEVIEADYIIWEINGRNDYTFSHNPEELKCLRESQTWEELRKEADYKVSPEDLWGPHNYRSCYVSEPHAHFTKHVHDIRYEILNHSSPNNILLEINYDAWHFFRVKVVASDYSFCTLTTTFAVKIIGVVTPNDLRDIAAANYTVLVVIILSLLGTYVWFHKKTVKKQQKPTSSIGRDGDGRLMDDGEILRDSVESHEKFD